MDRESYRERSTKKKTKEAGMIKNTKAVFRIYRNEKCSVSYTINGHQLVTCSYIGVLPVSIIWGFCKGGFNGIKK